MIFELLVGLILYALMGVLTMIILSDFENDDNKVAAMSCFWPLVLAVGTALGLKKLALAVVKGIGLLIEDALAKLPKTEKTLPTPKLPRAGVLWEEEKEK